MRITAGTFWLVVQTLENPFLFIPIDLLLIAALVFGMRTETFRKSFEGILGTSEAGIVKFEESDFD